MSDSALPPPPDTFRRFVARFPELGQAWEALGAASRSGPMDEAGRRLVKLGIAIGAQREGAVHAAARKALAAGVSPAALEQAVALAASTVGLPAAVAAWSWVRDVLDQEP